MTVLTQTHKGRGFSDLEEQETKVEEQRGVAAGSADSAGANRLIFKLLIFLITYLLNTDAVCSSLDLFYFLVTT